MCITRYTFEQQKAEPPFIDRKDEIKSNTLLLGEKKKKKVSSSADWTPLNGFPAILHAQLLHS